MELSRMVVELKSEAEAIAKDIESKKSTEKSLRLQLGALEIDIKNQNDRYEAIRMAIDSLELINDGKSQMKDMKIAEKTSVCSVNCKTHTAHSRKPKKIGKFDSNGSKLCEYASINQAAKVFGWNNTSMTKYIESTSKEKQIRIRGYYLQFITA